MDSNSRMWVVRAGEGAYLFEEFKTKNIVAMGWKEIGDLSVIKNQEQIKKMIREQYPQDSIGKQNISAGQLGRFRFDIKIEDYVVTYNPETRLYLVGKIKSDYLYDASMPNYKQFRKVDWIGEVKRDLLSTSTKNTLGAISTLFELTGDVKTEIIGILEGKKTEKIENVEESKAELETLKEDMTNKSREFVKDKVSQLDWEQMQELVAGVLRAMGYKILFIASRGADGGKDIIASPDGLGLEDPRIRVEVKHRKDQQMGRKEVSSFIGGLRPGHRGLYVSTGGFSKDARDEADRSNVPLTLIDLEMLVNLVVDNYDKFDSEAKELLPLTKIYWPE